MNSIWTRLMDRQHGASEGVKGKIFLTPKDYETYWPLIQKLHYGEQILVDDHPADPDTHYTHSLALGATSRMRWLPDYKQVTARIRAEVTLTGQLLW